MHAIYQIINKLTADCYVGSAVNYQRRKSEHLRDLRNERSFCVILQNAWNKYGSDCFEFSVLEEVSRRELLLEREQYWLDSIKPAYNVLKIAGSSKGRKSTAQQIEKTLIHTRKSVVQYSCQGDVIQEWASVSEAARCLGISASNISACCRGRAKSASGFRFTHKGTELVYNYKPRLPNKIKKYTVEFPCGARRETNKLAVLFREKGFDGHHVRSAKRKGIPNKYGIIITKNEGFSYVK